MYVALPLIAALLPLQPSTTELAGAAEVVPATGSRLAADDAKEGIFDNFGERRLSFGINRDLHRSLEGRLWPFFVGGLCSLIAMPVWLPAIVLGDAPEGYFEEALITWLIHTLPFFLVTPIYFIPYVGQAFGVLMCPVGLFVAFYLTPVNIINGWDRTAKRQEAQRRPKKRKTDIDAVPAPKDERLALLEPAMAF